MHMKHKDGEKSNSYKGIAEGPQAVSYNLASYLLWPIIASLYKLYID